MRLVKPLRASFIHRVFAYKNQNHLVATVAFCVPFDDPHSLVSEPEMWKLVSTELGRFGVLDYWMFKPAAEVLVTGACFTGDRPKPSEFVRVSVGPTEKPLVDKQLYVFGDRKWSMLGPSDPEPFTKMPIDYEHAFGGEKFALNPIGKGLRAKKDEDGAEVHPLPNVEDPKHLIKSKGDKPGPASLGAWDLMWPVHFEKKMGTYARDHAEKNGFSFADDIDFSLFNVAPEDQRLPGGFTGTEEIRVENMHPEHRVLETKLPGYIGRCFLRFKQEYDAGRGLVEVPLKIDTVHLFPNRERLIVFCRGVLPIATLDGADVEIAFFGVDEIDPAKQRPREHYESVLARRLDPDTAGLYALMDSELLPESAHFPRRGKQVGDRLEEVVTGEDLILKNAHRKAVREVERVKEKLVSAGLDPALAPPPPDPPAPLPSLDELPAFIEKARTDQEQAELAAKEKRAELTEHMKALAEELEIELPDLDATPKEGQGPPQFSVEEALEQMRGMLASAEEVGQDLPELRAKVDDPSFHAQLRGVEERLFQGYRLAAHFQLPAGKQDEESSARSKSALLALINGLEPSQRDFTGADLSEMDLRGANLEGALLEATNLTKTDLTGANLKGAVLAHAKLDGAKLDDADLTSANLGKVSGKKVSFADANLEDAILYGADLPEANFSRTRLKGVQAIELLADGATFEGAESHIPVFIRSSFVGANLRGVRFRQAVFVESNVARLDARGADMAHAAFLCCTGDDATFAGAMLENLRVIQSSFERGDFSNCHLLNCNLRGAKLKGAKLSFSNLRRSDFSEADLTGADMEGIVAVESLLMGTLMNEAKLTGADLMLCVMHRAQLAGADVTKANLFMADLSGAKGDKKTSFSGSNVKRALVAGVFNG